MIYYTFINSLSGFIQQWRLFKSSGLGSWLCFLLAGCAPQVYYFPADTGALVTYQKGQPQQQAVSSPLSFPGEQSGIPPLAAIQEPAITAYPVSAPARALKAHLSGPKSGSQLPGGAPGLWSPLKQEAKGQAYELPGKEKKIRKLGKTGFMLSLLGVGTLLLGLALPAVLFPAFLVAIMGAVLSITALTDKKKAPMDAADRWKATVGLVLGIITASLSIIVIISRAQWY